MRRICSAALLCGLVLGAQGVGSQTARQAPVPRVTPPPESFFQLVNEQDRDVARKFYAK
jgi:hypothetical protein